MQTERLLRLQTFVPHSQDSRLPPPETPDANGCENAYALAAGIKRAFVRYGSWETKAAVKKKDDRQPTLPGWDELSYLGVG